MLYVEQIAKTESVVTPKVAASKDKDVVGVIGGLLKIRVDGQPDTILTAETAFSMKYMESADEDDSDDEDDDDDQQNGNGNGNGNGGNGGNGNKNKKNGAFTYSMAGLAVTLTAISF